MSLNCPEKALREAYGKFSHEKLHHSKSFLARNHSTVSITTDIWDISFKAVNLDF